LAYMHGYLRKHGTARILDSSNHGRAGESLCEVEAYWRDEDEQNKQNGADSDASHSFPRRV
jgi:hypothetical protein